MSNSLDAALHHGHPAHSSYTEPFAHRREFDFSQNDILRMRRWFVQVIYNVGTEMGTFSI